MSESIALEGEALASPLVEKTPQRGKPTLPGALLQAIQAHFTPAQTCVQSQQQYNFTVNGTVHQPNVLTSFCGGSEANAVVNNFNALNASQKQDVLNFLRSL